MSGKYVFTKGLKELRFLHCQTSEHSNAVRYATPNLPESAHAFPSEDLEPLWLIEILSRSFLTRAYPTMKHHNPHTPIMIREASGVQPRVYARYEFGREKMADLNGMRTRIDYVYGRQLDTGILTLCAGLDDKAIEEKVTTLVKDGQ
jgi:NADH dehydrogenase (ubiquinone) 1 alpha subcomplex subunit 2